jgi:hypothetical protein
VFSILLNILMKHTSMIPPPTPAYALSILVNNAKVPSKTARPAENSLAEVILALTDHAQHPSAWEGL